MVKVRGLGCLKLHKPRHRFCATISNQHRSDQFLAEGSAARPVAADWGDGTRARLAMTNSRAEINTATQVNGGSKGVGGGYLFFSDGIGVAPDHHLRQPRVIFGT